MTNQGSSILDDLSARGLIQDSTDLDALRRRLDEGPITVYCGFDPSADSLHVGNLIGLLALRRFQEAGHRPIVLAGGATGMIGDPGGRSSERNLLDEETLTRNLEGIVPQLQQFITFGDGPTDGRLVDNRTWTVGMGALEFLRDVGKHVTVNQMLAKESVKARIEGEAGISYTEFSYMLLQANDFVELAALEDCEMQIGGSDQWGNVSLGVDLVRRRLARQVHALTWPLLTRPDGTKYGKSAAGEQLWLGRHRLSPYRFYQGWVNAEDSEMRKLLLQLTMLSVEDVDEVVAAHDEAPHLRAAQHRLAFELTGLVHGIEAAEAAAEASAVLFGGGRDQSVPAEGTFEVLAEEIPTVKLTRDQLASGVDLIELMAEAAIAKSRSEARQLVDQGGISLNGATVEQGMAISLDDLIHGRFALLRRGKRNFHLISAQ